MNKDDIKKGLECCDSTGSYVCDDCPYYYDDGCRDKLIDAALDLITEQEKEIEQLKSENKQAKIDVLNKLKERIKTAIDTYFNLDGGGYYLAEGAIDDIDGLIEEVEK